MYIRLIFIFENVFCKEIFLVLMGWLSVFVLENVLKGSLKIFG